MDGVLNIHKPSHMTSHDVVERVRRMLKEKRIGHTGTLDPLATGVLVLCVGKATRIAQYLEEGEKEYQAVMRLGITTDTLDAEGRVLETRSYMPPDRQKLIEVMERLRGSIMQQPPIYSALKVGGVPSYKLARAGKAEPLAPRLVTIYKIDLASYEDPFIGFTVRCSKGVYIRTLCADIGEALGMGAHLTSLIRTRSGRFSIDQAVTLGQLDSMITANQMALMPISEALSDFPALSIAEKESARVLQGGEILCPEFFATESRLVKLQDPTGRLLALARIAPGVLKPVLVFS